MHLKLTIIAGEVLFMEHFKLFSMNYLGFLSKYEKLRNYYFKIDAILCDVVKIINCVILLIIFEIVILMKIKQM